MVWAMPKSDIFGNQRIDPYFAVTPDLVKDDESYGIEPWIPAPRDCPPAVMDEVMIGGWTDRLKGLVSDG